MGWFRNLFKKKTDTTTKMGITGHPLHIITGHEQHELNILIARIRQWRHSMMDAKAEGRGDDADHYRKLIDHNIKLIELHFPGTNIPDEEG